MYTGVGALLTAQYTFAVIDPGTETVDPGLRGPGADGKPIDTIQTFISGLLTFLGLIMVAMALWGGWKILTSGAEDEGKEAGKKIIINAVIGIVVIFFAWTLTNLLFSILAGNGKIQ
jgi:hypothetical protein